MTVYVHLLRSMSTCVHQGPGWGVHPACPHECDCIGDACHWVCQDVWNYVCYE